MAKMNPVVHFEMPAKDKHRMMEFYSKTFGWETKELGPEMGGYVTVSTTETDENRMVKRPGAINGGFYSANDNNVSQAPSVVIAVDDIYESMKMVEAAGGTILGGSHQAGQPDDIPGVGLYCSFIDTEGNRVSMLQPKGM